MFFLRGIPIAGVNLYAILRSIRIAGGNLYAFDKVFLQCRSWVSPWYSWMHSGCRLVAFMKVDSFC